MTRHRHDLPQLGDDLFFTDGGLETSLIFHHGIDLPHFAAFPLLLEPAGVKLLRDYFESYARASVDAGFGFILESPTWRANPSWGARLGYDAAELERANRGAIELLIEIREALDAPVPVVVSGCIGPRGDGYVTGETMGADEARSYHEAQIAAFSLSGADMVSAMTLTYAEEAAGVVKAANSFGIPAAIGFTTETDGRLPDGSRLCDAIETVDALTGGGPAYYTLNCAHPDHFRPALLAGEAWLSRVRGVRANASRLSHAELDAATELDDGDPGEFGRLYQELRARFPNFSVLGGCCGTDLRHVCEARAACAT